MVQAVPDNTHSKSTISAVKYLYGFEVFSPQVRLKPMKRHGMHIHTLKQGEHFF
ncbi:hypothetical protein NECAME_09164 [Necator americanus]|uniref:Uncharacterized protein n=1 Tax=Necator americanus TaxID=51031 RepID=W2TFR5_NECAM|nr:hypothetical protein NECAME_09164 [Necator americanus]ETN80434.1 hypothetical protein NECAME_09164 [Necator americanus]